MFANAISTQEALSVDSAETLALERGEGAWVWDTAGQGYLDCTGGQGAAIAGHANPKVVQAIQMQVQQAYTNSDGVGHASHSQLLDELASFAPPGMGQVLLCGGEGEVVRAALQLAWWHTRRTQVVVTDADRRFLDSPILSHPESYRFPAGLSVPEFKSAKFNQLDQMEQMISEATAAVILPIVQVIDGLWPVTMEYLRGVQALCQERSVLLIVDETQTGLGCTGRGFACQHYDVQPDLLYTGSSIAAGLPLAALFVSQRLGELPSVAYSNALYSDPISCAAALATVSFAKSNLLTQRAGGLGQRLAKGLEGIPSPLVKSVQTAGLMVAVELKTGSRPFLAALAERGVLAEPAGEKGISFRPPLVISEAEVDSIVETMAQVLGHY